MSLFQVASPQPAVSADQGGQQLVPVSQGAMAAGAQGAGANQLSFGPGPAAASAGQGGAKQLSFGPGPAAASAGQGGSQQLAPIARDGQAVDDVDMKGPTLDANGNEVPEYQVCLVCDKTTLKKTHPTCTQCDRFYTRYRRTGVSRVCIQNDACYEIGEKAKACTLCRFKKCIEVGMEKWRAPLSPEKVIVRTASEQQEVNEILVSIYNEVNEKKKKDPPAYYQDMQQRPKQPTKSKKLRQSEQKENVSPKDDRNALEQLNRLNEKNKVMPGAVAPAAPPPSTAVLPLPILTALLTIGVDEKSVYPRWNQTSAQMLEDSFREHDSYLKIVDTVRTEGDARIAEMPGTSAEVENRENYVVQYGYQYENYGGDNQQVHYENLNHLNQNQPPHRQAEEPRFFNFDDPNDAPWPQSPHQQHQEQNQNLNVDGLLAPPEYDLLGDAAINQFIDVNELNSMEIGIEVDQDQDQDHDELGDLGDLVGWINVDEEGEADMAHFESPEPLQHQAAQQAPATGAQVAAQRPKPKRAKPAEFVMFPARRQTGIVDMDKDLVLCPTPAEFKAVTVGGRQAKSPFACSMRLLDESIKMICTTIREQNDFECFEELLQHNLLHRSFVAIHILDSIYAFSCRFVDDKIKSRTGDVMDYPFLAFFTETNILSDASIVSDELESQDQFSPHDFRCMRTILLAEHAGVNDPRVVNIVRKARTQWGARAARFQNALDMVRRIADAATVFLVQQHRLRKVPRECRLVKQMIRNLSI